MLYEGGIFNKMMKGINNMHSEEVNEDSKEIIVDFRFREIGSKLFRSSAEKFKDANPDIIEDLVNAHIEEYYSFEQVEDLASYNLIKMNFQAIGNWEVKIRNVIFSIAPTPEDIDNLTNLSTEHLDHVAMLLIYEHLVEYGIISQMLSHNTALNISNALLAETDILEETNYSTIKGLYFDLMYHANLALNHILRFNKIAILGDSTPVFEALNNLDIFDIKMIRDGKLVPYDPEILKQ